MDAERLDIRATAVIAVDVQSDFTEDRAGTLAVPGTDRQYLTAVVAAIQTLSARGFPIFYTQDWHPPDHVSFYTNHPGCEPFQTIEINGRSQILWPPHCVQNTPGAALLIPVQASDHVVRKGTDRRFDSYSGFADDGGRPTELDDRLKGLGIRTLIVFGLATDFCVRATVLDALGHGYAVHLLTDLCRGVAPDSTEEAVAEMRRRDVQIGPFNDFV